MKLAQFILPPTQINQSVRRKLTVMEFTLRAIGECAVQSAPLKTAAGQLTGGIAHSPSSMRAEIMTGARGIMHSGNMPVREVATRGVAQEKMPVLTGVTAEKDVTFQVRKNQG